MKITEHKRDGGQLKFQTTIAFLAPGTEPVTLIFQHNIPVLVSFPFPTKLY